MFYNSPGFENNLFHARMVQLVFHFWCLRETLQFVFGFQYLFLSEHRTPLPTEYIFCFLEIFAPCKGIRTPGSRKILFMESGILGWGIRVLTNNWNPESKFYWQILESSILNLKWRIQDCPGFPYVGRRCHPINFVAFSCTSDRKIIQPRTHSIILFDYYTWTWT